MLKDEGEVFSNSVLPSGIPKLITSDMVKEGAAVIDVGINYVHDPVTGKTKLVGDVDFEGNKLYLFLGVKQMKNSTLQILIVEREPLYLMQALTTLLITAPLSSEGQECNHHLFLPFLPPSSFFPSFLPFFISSFLFSSYFWEKNIITPLIFSFKIKVLIMQVFSERTQLAFCTRHYFDFFEVCLCPLPSVLYLQPFTLKTRRHLGVCLLILTIFQI